MNKETTGTENPAPSGQVSAYAVMVAMKPGDLAGLARKIVKVSTTLESAKTEFTESLQVSAKIVAAMKSQHSTRLDAHDIPPGTTFRKYFNENAGGDLPGRVEAMASLFNRLCLTNGDDGKPLLAESAFDGAAVDWLERANRILSKIIKANPDSWKTHDITERVISALSSAGDAGKKLKDIEKEMKPEKAEATETAEAPPLTAEVALAFLQACILNARADEAGKALFVGTARLGNAWAESGLDAQTRKEWIAELKSASKPVEKPATETPAEAPALQLQAA